jgi:multidrug efflux pump subunit AcrA (membrane-fusion protein)
MLVLQSAAAPGARVKKGDVIAEFDRQYMLTRLDDFRASVAQAEASYKKLLAQIDVNKKAHNQTIDAAVAAVDKAKLDMKTLPVLSSMDAERRKLTLEEAEARLRQLREEVRHVDIGIAADKRTADLEMQQSKLELRRAEMNADRMIMKAPIDGLVVMQSTMRGSEFDQIKPGDQLMPGMMFMQIVEPGSMVINATVNQADVERLRIGHKAHVKFDAFPGLELPAHISAIGSVARASRFRPDWVKEMALVLKIDRMDPRVIPDLSVSCNVVLHAADAPAVVPREGIFQDGPGSKPYVYVRSASGGWERREVETGLGGNTRVAVKSGLTAGEIIALDRPQNGMKPETVSSNPAPERASVASPARRRRWFELS